MYQVVFQKTVSKSIRPASKVAQNPTRPRVLTPASIWLSGTETVF